MSILYKLNKNIVGRTAANLVFALSDTKNVRIIKEDRCFNGTSLLGILANNLCENDNIEVIVEDIKDIPIIKEAFQDLGKEVEQC